MTWEIPNEAVLFQVLLASSTALLGIVLAFVAILFSIYSVSASPTPDRLERPPVVHTVRMIAWVAVAVLTYNSIIVGLSLVGLMNNFPGLLELTVGLFVAEIIALPVLVSAAIWKVMR